MQGGYKGFYSRNTVTLTPKSVNDIHKRGGTILGTSRGGHDTAKIVDSLQDRGINQVYIIGGDGTQQGASVIYEVTTIATAGKAPIRCTMTCLTYDCLNLISGSP